RPRSAWSSPSTPAGRPLRCSTTSTSRPRSARSVRPRRAPWTCCRPISPSPGWAAARDRPWSRPTVTGWSWSGCASTRTPPHARSSARSPPSACTSRRPGTAAARRRPTDGLSGWALLAALTVVVAVVTTAPTEAAWTDRAHADHGFGTATWAVDGTARARTVHTALQVIAGDGLQLGLAEVEASPTAPGPTSRSVLSAAGGLPLVLTLDLAADVAEATAA